MVLPAPDGPTIATRPRVGIVKLTLVEHGRAAVAIAEADFVEAHERPVGGRRGHDAVILLLDRQLLDAAEPLDGGEAGLQLRRSRRDPRDRLGQVEEVEQEGDQVADLE